MDKQAVIDRILETENLTDGLEDEDAHWLLDWGIHNAPILIDKLPEDDAAGAKLNQLMAVMRKINQIVSDRQDAATEDLAEAITGLVTVYAQAFGCARLITSQEALDLAASLSSRPARQAMQAIIETIQPASKSSHSS
jgi:tRNA splicing ligase